MKDALKVVPRDHSVEIGVDKPAAVAKALAAALADTYHLTFKTHACHWNVEGPFFRSIHLLTEEQYEDLFAATDELAERIRALGQLTPLSLEAILKASAIEDLTGPPAAATILNYLAEDHETLSRRMHEVVKTAEDAGDVVTADLATQRAAFHEKAAWMLRASAAQ